MQLIVTVHVKKCLQLTFMETHFSVLHGGGGCKVQYSYRSETAKKVFYLCNMC